MMRSPGCGFALNNPYGVATAFRSSGVANAGRSVKTESLLSSRPVVILNGRPDVNVMKGLRNSLAGSDRLAPATKSWRLSFARGPHSAERSYEFAGSVRAPSVLPYRLPNV